MPAFFALSAALHVALFGAWLAFREPVSGADIQVAAIGITLRPSIAPLAETARSEADADPAAARNEPRGEADERGPHAAPPVEEFAEAPAPESILPDLAAGEEGPEADEAGPDPAGEPLQESPAGSAIASGQSLSPVTPSSGDEAIREQDGPDPVVTAEQLAIRIHEAVQPYFEYPLLARRRGWEGEVLLALRVEPDGRLSVLRVLSSSGHRLLDRAAVEALARLERLPDARGLPRMGMETELPVRYRLMDPA